MQDMDATRAAAPKSNDNRFMRHNLKGNTQQHQAAGLPAVFTSESVSVAQRMAMFVLDGIT
jgi:hypothetical protein